MFNIAKLTQQINNKVISHMKNLQDILLLHMILQTIHLYQHHNKLMMNFFLKNQKYHMIFKLKVLVIK